MGDRSKTFMGMGGALAGAVTAYQYDWNLLPIGQALWLKELETYKEFADAGSGELSYFDQVMNELKKAPPHPEPVT